MSGERRYARTQGASIEPALRALLDYASAGAALQDAEGRYVFVTRDFEEAHGLQTGTMCGATDAELLGPEAAGRRAIAASEARVSGRARFEYLRRDGGRVCGDVLDLEPGVGARLGIALRTVEPEDLRPTSEIRQRLHEAERRGRIGSWVWDLSSDLVIWSAELSRMYGREHDGEPVPFEDALAHQHPSDRDWVARLLRKAVTSGEPFAFERRIITADQRLHWMHCQGTVETDAEGRPVRARGTDQDVTERRLVREQLTRLHRRSQLILESVSEGIVGLDRGARITFANGAALRMLGRTRDDLDDVKLHELLRAGGAVHPILATLDDGHERHVARGQLRQAGGTPLPVDFTSTAVGGPTRAEGVVVTLRDRSLRERYEIQIDETMSALAASDAHRRELLLNLVAAQELERRRIAAEIHDDAVQAMSAVALRVEQLAGSLDVVAAAQLRRLEDVVRDATGRLRQLLIQLQPPELETAIGPAIEAYVVTSSLPFSHVLDDRLTEQPSMATRVVLFRIAQEALRNVAKHAQASTVRTELTETDGALALTIADDGVGVAPGLLEVSRPGHLGIDTMRYRAELAGGRCTIRSTPGAGTTVAVALPRHEDHGR